MQNRKSLTHHEINLLFQSVKQKSCPSRGVYMVLLTYFHGLCVSEFLSLQLSDLEPVTEKVYTQRIKDGFSIAHSLQKEEAIAVTSWLDERNSLNAECFNDNPWLSISRTGKPLLRQRFYNIVPVAGKNAGLDTKVYPYMLCHAYGYSLADSGVDTHLIQDYLGHYSIRYTVIYTASSSTRFGKIWGIGDAKKQHFGLEHKPNLCLGILVQKNISSYKKHQIYWLRSMCDVNLYIKRQACLLFNLWRTEPRCKQQPKSYSELE